MEEVLGLELPTRFTTCLNFSESLCIVVADWGGEGSEYRFVCVCEIAFRKQCSFGMENLLRTNNHKLPETSPDREMLM